MDYPLYLRPKFRRLNKIMAGKKYLPKRYRFRMSSTYWDTDKSKIIHLKGDKCSQNISQLIIVLPTLNGRGNGAYAKQDLVSGTYLGCYLGKIVDNICNHQINEFSEVAYRFEMPFQDWSICALRGGNNTRYFNHSDNENIEVKGICHENEYHLGFFTKNDIKEGTELTINYGIEYWEIAALFEIYKK